MTDLSNDTAITPWDEIFPSSSRESFVAGQDIVTAGDRVDKIYLIEYGAVVETRADQGETSHAVNLSGPGSLVGLRITSSGGGIHEIRATALAETTLRSLPRDEFLSLAMRRGDLSSAVMHDLARRTEIARRLSDSCHSPNTSRHLLDVLEIVSSTFGQEPDGLSAIAVPPALLERMTGCPWLLIRQSLSDMQTSGKVVLGNEGVSVRALVS